MRFWRNRFKAELVASIPNDEWESLMGHEKDLFFLMDDRLSGRMSLETFQSRLADKRKLLLQRVHGGWFDAEQGRI